MNITHKKMSKKILKPFSIKEWKNGAKVETRDGRAVRILCTDVKCMYGYSIVAVIDDGECEHVHTFTEEGHHNDVREDEFDLVIIEEVEEPERWADDKNAEGEGWYVDATSRIIHGTNYSLNASDNTNLFATEKQAKSALAMAHISQLMANDERYGGVVADEEWKNISCDKYILNKQEGRIVPELRSLSYHFLAFHTAEQRDLFFKENKRLVKDYLMID